MSEIDPGVLSDVLSSAFPDVEANDSISQAKEELNIKDASRKIDPGFQDFLQSTLDNSDDDDASEYIQSTIDKHS